jgi:dihydroneopterin aldolase
VNNKIITWTIEVEDIETFSRVGILAHERELQPIRIRISMQAIAPAFPHNIEDCINYEPICRWLTDVWPMEPHTPLLETRVRELVNFLFCFDTRIERVNVGILKLKAIPQARGVGVRVAMTRSDHELTFGWTTSVQRKEVGSLTFIKKF